VADKKTLLTASIRAIGAFDSVPVEAIEKLVEDGRVRHFAVGQRLMRQGEPSDRMYVLLAGRVRVERANQPDQQAVVLAEFGPGELVGELEVLDHTPRSATVVALESTQALEVDASALAALVAESPALAGAFRQTVSGRLRNTNVLAAELFADLLSKVPMFKSVSADALSRLAERGQLRTFAPGTALMRQGEPGTAMYVLAAGHVQVARGHPSLLADTAG